MKDIIKRVLREDSSDRLFELISRRLNQQLSNCEIIFETNGSMWFIDRDTRQWYFEFDRLQYLWFRSDLFDEIFGIFSMDTYEYEHYIKLWFKQLTGKPVKHVGGINEEQRIKVTDLLSFDSDPKRNQYVKMVIKFKDLSNNVQ